MFKKAKKSVAWLTILVLAFIIIAGNFAAIQFASAATVSNAFFSNLELETRVEYGDTFTAPTGAGLSTQVKTPGGKILTGVGSVTANEIGTYEVTLKTTDNGSYKYNVECFLEGERILVVDKNGATLPSVWQAGAKNMEGDIVDLEIPNASVYIYDEDRAIYVKDSNQVVSVTQKSPNADGTAYETKSYTVDASKDNVGTFTPTEKQLGTWFFTYSCNVKGAVGDAGTEVLSTEYTVNVQAQFTDEEAPTLTRSSTISTGSVNTKVNVPTATVFDRVDSRVYTEILVKHTYAGTTEAIDVPAVLLDKHTGYVTSDEAKYLKDNADIASTTKTPGEGETLIFDNDKFMSFYPTEVGPYTLTYQAMDSSYYYGLNNKTKTTVYTGTINVTDTTAPTFDKVDSYKIPTSWGNTVKQYSKDDAEGAKLTNTNIEFPIPEVYDNAIEKDEITISFVLKDKNSKDIVNFKNINGTEAGEENYITGNSRFGKTDNDTKYYFFRHEDNKDKKYSVDANGDLKDGTSVIGKDFRSVFNFDLYNPDKDETKNGAYSIVYKASDSISNQTLNYSLTYSAEFKDVKLPDIYFSAPKTLSFTKLETEETISGISFSDTQTSRLNNEFYIVFNSTATVADKTSSAEFDAVLASGEKVELNSASGVVSLELKNDGTNNTVTLKDVNNDEVKVDVDTTKSIYVIGRATDSVGNTFVRISDVIKAVDATNSTGKTIAVTEDGAINAADATRNELYVLGSFDISYAGAADREFTGFEIYAQRIADANGDVLTKADSPIDVTFETYSDNTGTVNTINVDNVRFTPTKKGTYMVMVRGFHISGKSAAHVAYVEVDAAAVSDDDKVTAAIGVEFGEINVTYPLTTEFKPGTSDPTYVVRSITGGRMSLMYNQFTAMSTGAYSFTDYTAKYAANKVAYDANNIPVDSKSHGTYSMTANDSQSPIIRVLGDSMPVYANKGTVTLPNVSATSKNGIAAEVKCEVSFDGEKVTSTLVAENQYSFVAEQDGTYTVTYTANLNGNSSNVSFEIKCGDVISPAFRVIDKGTTSSQSDPIIGYINDKAIKLGATAMATVGDSFKFGVIDCLDPSTSGYTFTKQLLSSSGDVVATVSSAANRDNGSKISFSVSGTYTVVYTVVDEYNNKTEISYNISVSASSATISSSTITALTVVLIVVGIILVVGIVVYLVRFRKHKR